MLNNDFREKEIEEDPLDLDNLDFRQKSKSIYIKGIIFIKFIYYRPTDKIISK